jgi:hypothetical protein
MEQRLNDTDRGKPKDWERNLSQCHFVHRIYLRLLLALNENALYYV